MSAIEKERAIKAAGQFLEKLKAAAHYRQLQDAARELVTSLDEDSHILCDGEQMRLIVEALKRRGKDEKTAALMLQFAWTRDHEGEAEVELIRNAVYRCTKCSEEVTLPADDILFKCQHCSHQECEQVFSI